MSNHATTHPIDSKKPTTKQELIAANVKLLSSSWRPESPTPSPTTSPP